ncbi:MAG: ion transporter [Planctomycetes bacterium]|nr:ion transporter [Planctomycetota bacterium]
MSAEHAHEPLEPSLAADADESGGGAGSDRGDANPGDHSGRAQIWRILDGQPDSSAAVVVSLSILALIVLNVAATMLETVDSIQAEFATAFEVFEVCSVCVFTAEYLLRLWSCTSTEEFQRPIVGRLRWMLTPMALVDLVSVLPFFLRALTLDMRFLRALRLLRFFRLLKIGRYARSMRILRRVVTSKKEELLITGFLLGVTLILAASVVYYVERDAQPDKFSSIPESMWWAVATLSTVGYGDTYPITTLGRICAGMIAIAGIGLFGLPAGIVASGFLEEVEAEKQRKARAEPLKDGHACPHCGEPIRVTLG